MWKCPKCHFDINVNPKASFFKCGICGTKRAHCEMCGKKLKVPEIDYAKIAACDKCIKGQFK